MAFIYGLLIANLVIMAAVAYGIYLERRSPQKMDRVNQVKEAKVLDFLSKRIQSNAKTFNLEYLTSQYESSQIEVLETLIEYYRREAQKWGIGVELALTPELTNEWIHHFHLIHIVGNLLQNALEALMEETSNDIKVLSLRVERAEDTLRLMVFNSFPLSKRSACRLEQWTTKGYSTKGSNGRGNGLGLVKQLVDERDGYMFLDLDEGVKIVIEYDWPNA